jgi:hypothetical protein
METTVDQEATPTALTIAQQQDAAASMSFTCTYSLAEVAALCLPAEWNGVLWLSRQLNAGRIRGYKVGRTWRMTDKDVAAFIDSGRKPAKPAAVTSATADVEPAPPSSILEGLSPRSRARVTRRE